MKINSLPTKGVLRIREIQFYHLINYLVNNVTFSFRKLYNISDALSVIFDCDKDTLQLLIHDYKSLKPNKEELLIFIATLDSRTNYFRNKKIKMLSKRNYAGVMSMINSDSVDIDIELIPKLSRAYDIVLSDFLPQLESLCNNILALQLDQIKEDIEYEPE